jgi:hypothetical protein
MAADQHYNFARGERLSEQTHFLQIGFVVVSRFFLNEIEPGELINSVKVESPMLPIPPGTIIATLFIFITCLSVLVS